MGAEIKDAEGQGGGGAGQAAWLLWETVEEEIRTQQRNTSSVILATVKSVSSTDDRGNEDAMANEQSSHATVACRWEPASEW
jgi:hypothetical protein